MAATSLDGNVHGNSAGSNGTGRAPITPPVWAQGGYGRRWRRKRGADRDFFHLFLIRAHVGIHASISNWLGVNKRMPYQPVTWRSQITEYFFRGRGTLHFSRPIPRTHTAQKNLKKDVHIITIAIYTKTCRHLPLNANLRGFSELYVRWSSPSFHDREREKNHQTKEDVSNHSFPHSIVR